MLGYSSTNSTVLCPEPQDDIAGVLTAGGLTCREKASIKPQEEEEVNSVCVCVQSKGQHGHVVFITVFSPLNFVLSSSYNSE